MDSGYFFCPYVSLTETPVVFQDLTGRDLTDRYEEYNRLVEQANEICREPAIKQDEQIVNWRKDGF